MKFEKNSQMTMDGVTQNEREWALAISTVESVDTRCPFCLKAQNLREMLFPLPGGELAAKRRCKFCKRTMTAYSAVVFLKGESEFGRFIATYPNFWFTIDADEWMAALDQLKAKGFKYWEFWKRYREIKPKKMDWDSSEGEAKINAAYEEYEATENAKEAREGKPAPPVQPEKIFVFRNIAGGLEDTMVKGVSLDESDQNYHKVVHPGGVQRFRKDAWTLLDEAETGIFITRLTERQKQQQEDWSKRAAEERRRQDAENELRSQNETDEIDESGR